MIMKTRRDRIFIVTMGVLLCFLLSSCSSAGNASSDEIKGTIYYDAVVDAWDSIDTGVKSMLCGWADDEDREALYTGFAVSFTFDQNINLNDENTPKYNQAVDVFVEEKC